MLHLFGFPQVLSMSDSLQRRTVSPTSSMQPVPTTPSCWAALGMLRLTTWLGWGMVSPFMEKTESGGCSLRSMGALVVLQVSLPTLLLSLALCKWQMPSSLIQPTTLVQWHAVLGRWLEGKCWKCLRSSVPPERCLCWVSELYSFCKLPCWWWNVHTMIYI